MKKRIAALMICLVLFLNILGTISHAASTGSDRFRSPEEYEAFLVQHNLPSDFVHISRFQFFGDIYNAYMNDSTHCSYHYEFRKKDIAQPLTVSINIDHDTTKIDAASKPLTQIPAGTDTMLKMKSPDTGNSFCYFRNGLYYIYQRMDYHIFGTLKSIEWFADGIHFQIPIQHQRLADYESVPILIQLLSASESEIDSAFEALCASADLTPRRLHFNTYYILIDAVYASVIVLTIAISYNLSKKRRARGSVTRRPQSSTAGELPLTAFTNHESPFDTPNTH